MPADLKLIEGAVTPGGTMASDETALKNALEAMAREPRGEVTPELAALGVNVIESAMARENGRKTRMWAAGGAFLVAAGASLALFFGGEAEEVGVASVSLAQGQVEVNSGAGWAQLQAGAIVSGGTLVRTAAGSSAQFSMDTEVQVSMRGASELSWPEGGDRRVALGRGSASFQVETLPKGESFVVTAGASTVTVHGTEFSVTLLDEAAAPCVIVTEGLVEVRGPDSKVWVSGGQETGCGLPEEAPAAAAEPIAEAAQPTKAAKRPAFARAKAPVEKEADSTLAEQNALFQKALVAEQNGRIAEARGLLDTFVAKYPDSPLSVQVRSQRASLNDRK